ncbi:MAG TPA: hypothetical protein VKA44_08830 [Gemmatimonadota bacterium]|nr:hypothetical protein [Gemmatimonadota bacterium]
MDALYILGIIGLVMWIALVAAILVGLVRLLPTFRRIDRVMDRLDKILGRAEGRVEPTLDRLERVTDDVQFVTGSLRMDVEAVGRTVEHATDSVENVLRMAERRAAELNGLLEVVQEEAEDTFLSTASVLRAIRGARGRERKRSGRRPA